MTGDDSGQSDRDDWNNSVYDNQYHQDDSDDWNNSAYMMTGKTGMTRMQIDGDGWDDWDITRMQSYWDDQDDQDGWDDQDAE